MNIKIEKYQEKNQEIWDKFVMEQSVNGSFLQTRNFLNYHPVGRFMDNSYMFFNEKNNLIAVCPACEKNINDEKYFISHLGSTYGGIIVGRKEYNIKNIISIVESLEHKLKKENFQRVILKITPDIFSRESSDLMRFILSYLEYKEFSDLSFYIDFNSFHDDIIKNFNQNKRRNIKKCINNKMSFKKLESCDEIIQFYDILCNNLEKYNTKPVHTMNEIWEFISVRLKNICECYGVYNQEGKMISGSMIFIFEQSSIIHTQYLCALEEYNNLSPMSYLYYKILEEMRERGYSKVSWGRATENEGKYLNFGLARQKESFGSKYSLNYTYKKKL